MFGASEPGLDGGGGMGGRRASYPPTLPHRSDHSLYDLTDVLTSELPWLRPACYGYRTHSSGGRMWEKRVPESEVARLLSLIAAPPNLRGDPTNPNVRLFEGGCVRTFEGIVRYEFA